MRNWPLNTKATNPSRQTTSTHATEQGGNLHVCSARLPFDNLDGFFGLLPRNPPCSLLPPSYILECPGEGL